MPPVNFIEIESDPQLHAEMTAMTANSRLPAYGAVDIGFQSTLEIVGR
jgi:hypothetical protein